MPPVTAFSGFAFLARGSLLDVALNVQASGRDDALVFDDRTGQLIDLDLRGSRQDIAERLAPTAELAPARGRGRPKLGVVAREVTLLPRHWDWLAAQPGGASAALRRLVDDARRADGGRTAQRSAQDAAYRFMAALAGDLPGFEEAVRALYAADGARFAAHTAEWPQDMRHYAAELAGFAADDA